MLELSNVTTTYRGMVAISDISFTVRAGEILTIAGANGAGKSTLLKTIAGMERAQTGAILFEEEPINQDPPHRITQRGIAFVPEARRLFSRLSVRDNLRLGSYLYRKKADRSTARTRVFPLSPTEGTARPAGGNAFGRRAADAGNWACVDEQTAAIDAG